MGDERLKTLHSDLLLAKNTHPVIVSLTDSDEVRCLDSPEQNSKHLTYKHKSFVCPPVCWKIV